MLGATELLTLMVLLMTAVAVLIWAVTRPRFRKLSEQMNAAYEANESRLAEIASELSAMRTQLAALERVLTQVE